MELIVESTLGGACIHVDNPYLILFLLSTLALLLSTLALLLSSLLYSHVTSTSLCPMYMIHQ